MILKAKHHFFFYPIMAAFVRIKLHKTFHTIQIKGDINDSGFPILMICNHISWWDGIWAFNVNRKLYNRKFHFMMKEEQLKNNWFLSQAGGYSISSGSKSITESLAYTVELLADSNNMVLLFPQGEIYSMHNHEIDFRKGIEYILSKVKNKIQICFLANVVDFHSHVKPTVYSYIYDYHGSKTLSVLETSYNIFYKQCISELAHIKY